VRESTAHVCAELAQPRAIQKREKLVKRAMKLAHADDPQTKSEA